ncbi:uncharacterized protein [Elaeis guineensis]|uniref:Trafficking protein particle complex subunit 2 isoform X3 n=1 Tax=Elaeis guineensis var. tenera TaxID=51953 RepID=A0A6I9RLX7_ELAGV|nr:trafficking protein particle complex subunit 2 isoform X3 [Elaeis guineensis]XP_010925158.1 trafficking protein particle complex subunit 2 isoform X3 [Elaeis guineensis]XP_029121180.1 trafficking protein particle complex subunit 2 isoform X4 [Elaeis guineensis]
MSKEIFSGAVGGAGGNWIKKQTHILSCLPYNSYTPAFFHILGINQIVAACQTLFPNFFTGCQYFGLSWAYMANMACFIIVSRNDIPIYEAEVGSAPKKEEAAHQHQFILHAALDIVQDLAWTTSAMFLKAVDRFNDLVVSVYVTAGHTRLMLLHDSRNEDGIKSFFQDVQELYVKILLNPLYLPGSRITSSHFDTKVRALARKYL